MCGIVGAVSSRNVVPMLIDGLKILEYRGYDSSGLAVLSGAGSQNLTIRRSTNRVERLERETLGLSGLVGIAHTRWATHGVPSLRNAHPHASDRNGVTIAVVHNGIIENHDLLRAELAGKGYVFVSETDTEVIAHLTHFHYQVTRNLARAMSHVVKRLVGSYAIVAVSSDDPDMLVGARKNSPLVIGVGKDKENFLASDAMALRNVTNKIIFLMDGDIVEVFKGIYHIVDVKGEHVMREIVTVEQSSCSAELGSYRHFMQKEIFEQPRAVIDTIEGVTNICPELFSDHSGVLSRVERVLILACGTSYYSSCVAKYWIEAIAGIPVSVEIASEYRYRTSVPEENMLVVVVSQSGETADTLAALKHAKSLGMRDTLSICNVSSSAMPRETSLKFITRAGVEVGVASTKAFTTQLVSLYLLAQTLAKQRGRLGEEEEQEVIRSLRHLPQAIQAVLALEPQIIAWAEKFVPKAHALFLGRGMHYPVACEGALKLKEISYIHAEAYAAGELKHGPLALVDRDMPVVVVAPNDELIDKLKSNMQEVRARGGELFVFADRDSHVESSEGVRVIRMPEYYRCLSPIVNAVPLQLLAYHVAVLRGNDVDKPRNLAKSVTVE